MICLALTIVGVFLLISDNLRTAVDRLGSASRMTVYLDVGMRPPQIERVRRTIAAQEGFQTARYITPEEALRRFRQYFSSLGPVVDDLGSNPFPGSFEIELARPTIESSSFNQKVNAIRALPEVDTIEYDWEWTRKLRRVVRLIDSAGLIVGVVLALAASFMIANVIRLTTLLYKEEIEIMRLVGATERTIRGPFLIEGLLQGLIGGLMAVAVLAAGHALVTNQMPTEASLITDAVLRRPLSWQKLSLLVAGGVLAGLFGSWLSLRDYKPA